MKHALLIFILLALIPISTAQTMNIDYQILYNKVLVTEKISFEKEANLQLQIPEKAFAESVYVNSNQIFSTNDLYQIKNAKEVELNYLTAELLEKTSKKSFLTEIKIPADMNELAIRLTLPENSILDTPSKPNLSIFPKPLKTESDSQRTLIIWQFSNLKKDESISLFVIFKERADNSSLAILLIFLSVMLIGLVAYLIRKKKKRKLIKKRKIKTKEIEFHLMESEKAIINALKTAQRNELWQKQLQLQTGFSKAKLSRIIRNLEARNLIKKIPFGNTNKIVLK